MRLSRWAPTREGTGWKVTTEKGKLAPSPHTFPDYKKALRRSDDLNRAEQYAAIGHKVP